MSLFLVDSTGNAELQINTIYLKNKNNTSTLVAISKYEQRFSLSLNYYKIGNKNNISNFQINQFSYVHIQSP